MALTDNLNKDQLKLLGTNMSAMFCQYEKDRNELELKWLKTRRQFRGEYDPEVKKNIPADRSQAYPKLTRFKVISMVARLMDLLFPQTAENWNIEPTPKPDISEEDLNQVLSDLQSAGQQGVLTDEIIEKAVMEFSAKRCAAMKVQIRDQLADHDLDYITLVRKVVFSAVYYGCGVLKGPLVKREEGRKWIKNAVTGLYSAQTVPVLRPYYEFVPIWNFYPDLTAKTRDQMDGAFERHVYNRHELRKLADRPDFFGDQIREYIRNHPEGNFKEKSFENEMRGEKNSVDGTINREGKKYEVVEWWGYVSADDLKKVGVDVPESEMADDIVANIWIVDTTVIKIALSPYPAEVKLYHLFIYEEDDNTLLGAGLPENVRESQLSVCASARMLLDNASVVCGPMVEANVELLAPGTNTQLHSYKVFEREGIGQEAGIPAIREIKVDAHIGELASVVELFKGFLDAESMLPPSLQGDMTAQGKEPFRTAQNTSQLFGAAALPIRDVVRNFDQFTESVIGSLYYWNMEFNQDRNVKGDFRVQAQASTSLIAKEVRAMALDNLSVTMSPEDRKMIRARDFLIERLISRDLPAEKLVLSEEEIQQNAVSEMNQQMQMMQKQMQELDAKITNMNTQSIRNVVEAETKESDTRTKTFGAVATAIQGAQNEQNRNSGQAENSAASE